jgi:3-oxoisoapionate kinase
MNPQDRSPTSVAPQTGSLLLAFYGDDFTGSTDALEFMTRAGARTALFIAPPTAEQMRRYPGLQAVGVAGMTRALSPEAMDAELRPALTALRGLGAPHVHYKVCSTFDSSPTIGNIGRAIEVGTAIFKGSFVPLLVAAPTLGRYCVFGNLFARMGIGSAGEIHRLDRHPSMSRHPITPADESDLRRHLGRQTTQSIALFDILQVALPEQEAKAALEQVLANSPDIVLFDALYPEQLAVIGMLLEAYASADRPLFSVGSSGIEMALGGRWASQGRLTPVTKWTDPGPASPLLVISGSCSPVTDKQIGWALEHEFAEVPLDTAALISDSASGTDCASMDRAGAATIEHLQAGRSVIVHTSRGPADPRLKATADVIARMRPNRMAEDTSTASLFGSALGRVARQALETVRLRRLLLAGGDTSSYAARALGIESVEMTGSLVVGAPLCRAHAPASPADGLEVNFKGGQLGSESYFGLVARGKA